MEFKHIKENVERIKQDQVKRLPHGTMANIEDIHAIVNDLQWQNMQVSQIMEMYLISESAREYMSDRMLDVKDRLKDIQENPRKYKDRQSRKRNIV